MSRTYAQRHGFGNLGSFGHFFAKDSGEAERRESPARPDGEGSAHNIPLLMIPQKTRWTSRKPNPPGDYSARPRNNPHQSPFILTTDLAYRKRFSESRAILAASPLGERREGPPRLVALHALAARNVAAMLAVEFLFPNC